jgi:hypothetical protein
MDLKNREHMLPGAKTPSAGPEITPSHEKSLDLEHYTRKALLKCAIRYTMS